MMRRQTIPERWLLTSGDGAATLKAAGQLPRGSGIILLEPLARSEMRRLMRVALARRLTIVAESSGAARRVHNLLELRSALLARTPLILLSPIYSTTTHPDWRPLPRMRVAAIARLARRKLIALGGMNASRFARVRQLGFTGWAGISAFRT